MTKTPFPAALPNDNPLREPVQDPQVLPDFPDRFGSQEEARAFCQTFFPWYNEDHRHSGIGYHTPEAIITGEPPLAREARGGAPPAAYAAHPERFVRRVPSRRRSPARRGSTSRLRGCRRPNDSSRRVSQRG